MATYAIGDIHGCFTALQTVFDAIGPTSEDTIVFLGDYVDRGPGSRQTIQWIIEKSNEFNFIALKGNHEIMMIRSRVDPDFAKRWLGYGGKETLQSYDAYSPIEWDLVPSEHWAFIESTLPYFVVGKTVFVHAGLQPGIPLYRQSDQAKFWDKYEIPIAYDPNKLVVCGHTARKNGLVADFGHTICLDTCAYGGQWLTCLDVDSGKYWQANQKGKIRKGTRVG